MEGSRERKTGKEIVSIHGSIESIIMNGAKIY